MSSVTKKFGGPKTRRSQNWKKARRLRWTKIQGEPQNSETVTIPKYNRSLKTSTG